VRSRVQHLLVALFRGYWHVQYLREPDVHVSRKESLVGELGTLRARRVTAMRVLHEPATRLKAVWTLAWCVEVLGHLPRELHDMISKHLALSATSDLVAVHADEHNHGNDHNFSRAPLPTDPILIRFGAVGVLVPNRDAHTSRAFTLHTLLPFDMTLEYATSWYKSHAFCIAPVVRPSLLSSDLTSTGLSAPKWLEADHNTTLSPTASRQA
jgi:hypothetical protein